MASDYSSHSREGHEREPVGALVRRIAERLRSGDEAKTVIESYLRQAYDAHLSPEAVTDFFCVTEENVVELSQLSELERHRLITLFDDMNTAEVRRRVREHRL